MSEADRDVLERWVLERDGEAFAEIVVRYSGMVFATCRRILRNATDAEDAAQHCFEMLAVAKALPRAAKLGPWLHAVATNVSLQVLRSEGRRRKREAEFETVRAMRDEVQWDDVYAYVDEAVAGLPNHLREPIVAHFMEGKDQGTIAEEAGWREQR